MTAIRDWRKAALSLRKLAMISSQEDYLRAKGAFGYQVSVTPEGESAQKIGEFYRAPGFEDDGRRLLYRAF